MYRRRRGPNRGWTLLWGVVFLFGAILAGGYLLVQYRLGNVRLSEALGGATRTPAPSVTPTRGAQGIMDEAEAAYRAGDYRAAISLYEQALRRKPNDAELTFKITRLQVYIGQAARADLRLQRALQIDPNNALLRAGLCLAFDWEGRLQDAQRECNAALTADPNNVAGLAYLAEVQSDLSQFRTARATAQRALDFEPRNPDALRGMGYTYEVQGRNDDAIYYYGESLDAVPGQPHVLMAIGRNYSTKGLVDKAILYFKRVIEMDPGYAEAYERLGGEYARLREPQYDDARAAFAKAIELDPQRATIFTARARMNFELKRYEDSIVDITRAITTTAELSRTISALDYIYLGFAYQNTSQCSDAVNAFNQAMKVAPGDEGVASQAQNGLRRCGR